MRAMVLIAVGGAAGAILRYLIGTTVQRVTGDSFPLGTLLANVLGCFLIGVLYRLLQSTAAATVWQPLLVTGLLGALTTLSTFSLETLLLLEKSGPAALANVGLNLLLGLTAAYVGMQLGGPT